MDITRYMPVLSWGRRYGRKELSADLIAAVIVTIMLIPQSLAYALLAGLPPEAGLYASIAPIILYALFDTSKTLAVGPVAVVSLLTASAVGQVAEQGTAGYPVPNSSKWLPQVCNLKYQFRQVCILGNSGKCLPP